jgi:predicted negative regulator of RcsB-dependent stress response
MATTTVEPKPREQTTAPAVKTPWYEAHQRALLVALIILVAAAVVGWFIAASGKRKEQFAARSLNQARAAAEAGNLPLASSELQRLITTYKGTDAAREAVITLNQVRMVNGQNELAAVGLREFLASRPDPKYGAPANGLLGSALENSKHWPEAAAAYMEASKAADVAYLKAKYLVDAGRAYREAGRTEDAARAYRTVLEKHADTPSFTEAQVRLAELTGGKM